MATEKQVKQAIKQVLDSEYMNKMVTFDKGMEIQGQVLQRPHTFKIHPQG